MATQDPPPYITLTNIVAHIDTSIDNFVEQLSQRNPLKEISVNESGGKPSASASAAAAAAATKFMRVDGDFPKITVPLFEQMVYHRAGSMNLNPLSIFIPTGYKINFQEINEYFREMARRNDPETQELMNLVIAAYGNNNNSLFYRHTLPGKATAAGGARPVIVGGIRYQQTTPTMTTKGVFDLDPKTADFIQFKIDKWHRSYIDWCFYRNATRFFVENQQLPKDELVTLKMEFDEVYDAAPSGGKGLMKMVDVIQGHYERIQTHYDTTVRANDKIKVNSNDFQTFIYLFDILYAEIQKYKDAPLDYVTERKRYFPSYSFDANSLSLLLQVFEKFRSIFLQLKLLEDAAAHDVKNFIDTVPYLSQLETLQSIADEFMRLKQSIETNPALKTAAEIFEKYMLTSNRFVDVNGQSKYIPSYKIIQYVFQTIGYYNESRTTPPPPPPPLNGLFEGYVEKLYAGGGANPKDPKEIFDKPIDDDFIDKLFNESKILPANPYKAKMNELDKFINSHFGLIELLTKRKGLNKKPSDDEGLPVRSAVGKKRPTGKAPPAPPPPAMIFQAGEEGNRTTMTRQIQALNIALQAFVTTADADADEVYTNNDSLDNKIKQVEAKIKLLKGKYFVSSLLSYNHHFDTTPHSRPIALNIDTTAAAADFFQKFYTESKLETPELDSFPQKNAVPFSFGIDLIFWVLFRVSKYYFASFHANFIEKLKEQIGPQNLILRSLRENVQYNESKLNHVCEIVAKLLGVSVVRIIPDRSSYLIKTDGGVFKGFVDVSGGAGYSTKWKENIAATGGKYSAKIKYVTNEMTKGLDKALGLIDPATAPVAADENLKKMKKALVVLLEHNTVQVVHMLFAKPRDIWYSPDMRTGTLTSLSKWAFFRLEKPEIIAKSAFKLLEGRWDEEIVTPNGRRLDYILDNQLPPRADAFKITIIEDSNFKSNTLPDKVKSLCVFLVASQPSPQIIELGKDSTNDSRFQNPSFSLGGVEPSTNDDHAVGSKLMQKLKEAIKPDPEKCSNVRGLIQEEADQIKMLMMNAIRSGGVDTSIEIDELMIKRYRSMIGDSVKSVNDANTKAQNAISKIAEWVAAAGDAAKAAIDVGFLVSSTSKSKTEADAASAAANAAAVAAAAAAAAAAADALAAADTTISVSSLKKLTETAKEHEIEATKKLKETIKHADDSKSKAIGATINGITALKDFSHKIIDDNVTGYKKKLDGFKTKIRNLESSTTDPAISAEILIQKQSIDDISARIDDDYNFCNGEYNKFDGFIASVRPPNSLTNVDLLPIITGAKQAKEDIRVRVNNILANYPPQPTVPNIKTKIDEIEGRIKAAVAAVAAAPVAVTVVTAAAMLVNTQKADDILTAIKAEIARTRIILNYNSISGNVTDQFVTEVNVFLTDKLLNIDNKPYFSLKSVPWFKDTLANMVKITKLTNPITDHIRYINVLFNTVVVALRNIIELIIHTISFSSGVFDDSIKPRIVSLLTTPNLTPAVITKFQDVLRECQRIYDDDLSYGDFDTQKKTLDQMIKSITSSIASGTFAYEDATTVVKQINDVNASIDEFKRKFPYLQLLLDINIRVLGRNPDPDRLLEFIRDEKSRISGAPPPPAPPAPAPVLLPPAPAPPAPAPPAPAPAVPVAVAVAASAIIAATNPQQTIDEIKTILGNIETTLNPPPMPRLPPPVININYDVGARKAVGMKYETSRIVNTQLDGLTKNLKDNAQDARDLIDKIQKSIIGPISVVSGAGVSSDTTLEGMTETLNKTISDFIDLLERFTVHSSDKTTRNITDIINRDILDTNIDIHPFEHIHHLSREYIKIYNELLQSHTVSMNKTQQQAVALAKEYFKLRGDVKPHEPLSDFRPNQALIDEIEGLLQS